MPIFGLKNFRHTRFIQRIRREPINRFRRQRHHRAVPQCRRRLGDRFGKKICSVGFECDRFHAAHNVADGVSGE